MKTTSGKTFFFFVIFIIINICISYFLPILFWVNFIYDDCCFYVKTAYNLSQGFGSTFDGVNPTNGYQPLWFLTLSGIFYTISLFAGKLSPQFLLRTTMFLHFLLFYLTFYFTCRAFRIILHKHSTFLCVVLSTSLCITPVFIRNVGMEAGITTLLFSVYFWIKSREIILNEEHFLYKTILLMLVFLARIDFLHTFIPVIILYECYDKDLKVYFRKALTMGIPVLFTALVYFLNNYIYFGNILTVSSFTKSNFRNIFLTETPGQILHFFSYHYIISITVFLMFALLVFIIFRLYRKKDPESFKIEIFLFWMLAGSLLFILQHVLFNKEILKEWYFAGPIYFMAIYTAVFLRNKTFLSSSVSLAFLGLFVFYTVNARILHQKYDSFYDYAIELKGIVGEDEEVLQTDYSGIVGLISERRIVNGDGLINSFEFNEHVKNNTIKDYLKKYHIDYFSTYLATIDSSSNTITSAEKVLGGWVLTFPLDKIVYHKPQHFDSYFNPMKSDWYLISLK